MLPGQAWSQLSQKNVLFWKSLLFVVKFMMWLPYDSFPLIDYSESNAPSPWPGQAVIILPSHQVQKHTKMLITCNCKPFRILLVMKHKFTFSIIYIGSQAHFVPKSWCVEPLWVNNKTVAVPHLLMNLRKVSNFPNEWSIAISASLIIILVQLCPGQLLLELFNLDLLLVALLFQADYLLVQLPTKSIGNCW